MKDEVPPALIEAHLKNMEKAVQEGATVDANFGLDKTGVAGTGNDRDDALPPGWSIVCLLSSFSIGGIV